MAKSAGGKKAMTKSAMYAAIAEAADLKKADVIKVFDALTEILQRELGAKGVGTVTLPGMARFGVRKVKAVKGGQKKINPLTGQEYITKDKPAYNKVTVRPVKALKDALM